MIKTVAVLYPGDMGHQVAKVLLEDGYRVITVLQGRSRRTCELAATIGIEAVPCIGDVVSQADIILSIVPPNAVLPVAAEVIAAAEQSRTAPLFVDCNAKTPMTAQKLDSLFQASAIRFINACIIGPAAAVREDCKFFISGANRELFNTAFSDSFRIVDLGPGIENASVFKMAFAGFNKCVTAALFETAITANAFQIFAPLFAEIGQRMPGIVNELAKLVPTYPRHIARRADEMGELHQMLAHYALPAAIAAAAQTTFSYLASSNLMADKHTSQAMEEILQALYPTVPTNTKPDQLIP